MVATEVLPMDHTGVEEVPDTFICTAGSEREPKVKSVLFRLREAEEAEPDEEALVTLLRTPAGSRPPWLR